MPTLLRLTVLGLLASLLTACGSEQAGPASSSEHEVVPMTNRIDTPPAVRRNLGITFAKVQMRDVRNTMRVPGRFELQPEAHRSYHSALPGQVELLVNQYQAVRTGDVLFRVHSPTWHQVQKDLTDAVLSIRRNKTHLTAVKARLEATVGHASSLRAQRLVWQERLRKVKDLGAAGGGVATAQTQARAALAIAETALAEVAEEQAALKGEEAALIEELAGQRSATPLLYADALEARQTPADPKAGECCDLALSRAASLLGTNVAYLRENVGENGAYIPRWRLLDSFEVHARQAGVVEQRAVTNGAWIESGQVVLETVDPARIRFRGSGLQADLGNFRQGMTAVVLPPGGDSAAGDAVLKGTVTIGLEADPLTRTIDLILIPQPEARAHWARAGVSTEMEVVVARTPEPLLAIPLKAVIKDGLDRVIFRRDPKNPDKVIRLTADLGVSDGRWIVVESGLMEGDEVVKDGIYELMLASGGAKQAGGHFHADGTFHAGDDH